MVAAVASLLRGGKYHWSEPERAATDPLSLQEAA
jgi:hypothetical protein